MNADEAVDALEWPLSLWQKPGYISTGSVGLDLALGGGWPRGRISELYGTEGSGKTALARATAMNLRDALDICTWIGTKGAYEQRGMTTEGHIMASAQTDTQAVHVIRTAAESDLVVLDALEGLEIEHPDAAWNNHMVAAIETDLRQHDTAGLFLSGLKDFGGNGDYALNKAIRGRAAVRVRLDASVHRDYADVTATIFKNSSKPPVGTGPTVTFRVQDGKIDHERELAELGVAAGLITKRGTWYYYQTDNRVRPVKLAQGLDKVVTKIRENENVAKHIERELRGQ